LFGIQEKTEVVVGFLLVLVLVVTFTMTEKQFRAVSLCRNCLGSLSMQELP